MRIEVSCPACNKGYLLDQTSLGGEFVCPACLARIDLSLAANRGPLPDFDEPPCSIPVSTESVEAAPATPGEFEPVAMTGGATPPAASGPLAAAATEAPGPAVAAQPVPGTAAVASAVTSADPTAVAASTTAESVSAGAASVAPTPPTAEPAKREEVVCPRCNLHFSPRGRTAVVEPGDRPTVLVIEDMGYFRQIARDTLADEYEVRLAGSVDEAKRMLTEGDVNLIVLDLTLDGNDSGLQLLREMRLKACPVLIYTARDESEMYGEEWEELQKLGADDIVIKGMNVAESLRRKVAALLGRHWDDEDDIK